MLACPAHARHAAPVSMDIGPARTHRSACSRHRARGRWCSRTRRRRTRRATARQPATTTRECRSLRLRIDPLRPAGGSMRERARAGRARPSDEHPEAGRCGWRFAGRAAARPAPYDLAVWHAHDAAPLPRRRTTNPASEDDHILIPEGFLGEHGNGGPRSGLRSTTDLSSAHRGDRQRYQRRRHARETPGSASPSPNAIDEARWAAKRHTLANDEYGVAHAGRPILAGEWWSADAPGFLPSWRADTSKSANCFEAWVGAPSDRSARTSGRSPAHPALVDARA